MLDLNCKLLAIRKSLCEQDNRITDQPLFIVEQKVKDYGFTSDYAELSTWERSTDGEHEIASDELIEDLNEREDNYEDLDGWEKVYYKERWQFVTACFTEQGCKDYIKFNGHNLGKTRIYADGSYRNLEYQAIRKALIHGVQLIEEGGIL